MVEIDQTRRGQRQHEYARADGDDAAAAEPFFGRVLKIVRGNEGLDGALLLRTGSFPFPLQAGTAGCSAPDAPPLTGPAAAAENRRVIAI